jgi:hypothetical protein
MVDTMAKSLLGATTGLQATALMGHSAGYAQRSLKYATSNGKGKKGKYSPTKDMFGTAVGTMIGTGLIGAQSKMINAL